MEYRLPTNIISGNTKRPVELVVTDAGTIIVSLIYSSHAPVVVDSNNFGVLVTLQGFEDGTVYEIAQSRWDHINRLAARVRQERKEAEEANAMTTQKTVDNECPTIDDVSRWLNRSYAA